MPETVITAVASHGKASTLGSNSQMTGSATTPRKAVNTISTAVSLWRKYLSTRNLSMWVETAHNRGPEKAKSSHIKAFSHAAASRRYGAFVPRRKKKARHGGASGLQGWVAARKGADPKK